MEEFFDWLRKRFDLAELMHMVDIDNESLKAMLFENGPSRNAFMKYIVYKMLLDIDSNSDDGSKEHNLEKIFVTFGLLDKNAAQEFLKGDLPVNLHVATWKKIIRVLIPTTTIAFQRDEINYDEMMNCIYEKHKHFKVNEKKNLLPPELMSKLSVHKGQNTCKESNEEIVDKLIDITKKINGNDGTISNSKEIYLNDRNLEIIDTSLIQNEIDQFIKSTNKKKIVSSNNKHPVKMTSQQLADLANQQNLIQSQHFEEKVNNIIELMNVKQDLQTLISSLADV